MAVIAMCLENGEQGIYRDLRKWPMVPWIVHYHFLVAYCDLLDFTRACTIRDHKWPNFFFGFLYNKVLYAMKLHCVPRSFVICTFNCFTIWFWIEWTVIRFHIWNFWIFAQAWNLCSKWNVRPLCHDWYAKLSLYLEKEVCVMHTDFLEMQ